MSWINELEQELYSSFIEDMEMLEIDSVKDQSSYTLEDPYRFPDILRVVVGNIPYEKVLPFNLTQATFCKKSENSFTIEPAPIEARANHIVVFCNKRPSMKTVIDANTEKLDILEEYPYKYIELYENYLLQKICTRKREYMEANNYGLLYNESVREFMKFYFDRMPRTIPRRRRYKWREDV